MEVKTDTGRWCPETWKALGRHLRIVVRAGGDCGVRNTNLVGVTLLYITALPI